MIFQGSRAELMAASTPDVVFTCTDPHAAAAVLRGHGAQLTEADEVTVPGLDDRQTAGVVAALVGQGVGVFGVRRDEQTLEEVFMSLTAGGRL